MSVLNNQNLFSVGNRLHINKYDQTTGLAREWRDIGTIKGILNPDVKPTVATAIDSRSGLKMKIAKRIVMYEEQYSIETINMSLENLIFLYGDNVPRNYTQSASPATVISPFFQVDSLVPLLDSSGNFVYNIASITSVKDQTATTTYTAGVDYIVIPEYLMLGYLYIPPTSSINTLYVTGLSVTYVANAIATSAREILPWTSTQMTVQFRSIYTQPSLSFLLVREGTAYITAGKPKFDDSDYATVAMDIDVIGSVTTTTSGASAGRVLMPQGTLPTIAQP